MIYGIFLNQGVLEALGTQHSPAGANYSHNNLRSCLHSSRRSSLQGELTQGRQLQGNKRRTRDPLGKF